MEAETIVAIIGVIGFALSEVIGLVPGWKSNSVLQLLAAVMKAVGGKK